MMTDVILNDIFKSLPLLIVGLGSLFVLFGEVLKIKNWPGGFVSALILIAAIYSLCVTKTELGSESLLYAGVIKLDSLSIISYYLLLTGTLAVVCFTSIFKVENQQVESKGEFYSLLLLATFGALVLVSAVEFITWFLGLEIMSMALYCLCASAIRRKDSSESGMKYFLLGSFSSAFLLYGIAFLYGLSGSTYFDQILVGSALANVGMFALGLGLVFVGIAFKIGLVPFHYWVPDVYQGAPMSITVYMASIIKAAAFMTAIRLLWFVFGQNADLWIGALWFCSAITIVVANIVALRQRNVKRMLCYSSIAHAGYVSMALLIPEAKLSFVEGSSGVAIVFYLVVYTIMTIGSFAILAALESISKNKEEGDDLCDDISNFEGLSTREPFLAAMMSIFMLALAGLPPAMGGFVAKFYLFAAVIKEGYIGLSVIAVLSAVVACYYYLRVIVAMYFSSSDVKESSIKQVSVSAKMLISVCAVLVVLLGIFPNLVLDIIASNF